MRTGSASLSPHVSIPLYLDGGVRDLDGGEKIVCVRISLRTVLAWTFCFNLLLTPVASIVRDFF